MCREHDIYGQKILGGNSYRFLQLGIDISLWEVVRESVEYGGGRSSIAEVVTVAVKASIQGQIYS